MTEGIESWHKTVRRECISPRTPLDLSDARRLGDRFVSEYNHVGLHGGLNYVTPEDRPKGRDTWIWRRDASSWCRRGADDALHISQQRP